MLGVFAAFSAVLSGMQVGLETDQLGKDATFHRVSHGFALFSFGGNCWIPSSTGLDMGGFNVIFLYLGKAIPSPSTKSKKGKGRYCNTG